MPDRPGPPSIPRILSEHGRAIRALQRTRPGAFPPSTIDIWDDGEPQGPADIIDFIGNGVAAMFAEDGHAIVDISQTPATFDAIVDLAFTASDPENRLFRGIGEALTYLGPSGLGLTRALVLVRPAGTGTYYTETSNWNSPATVRLFAIGGNPAQTSWDIRTFENVAKATSTLYIENMRVQAGTVAVAPLAGILVATNCWWQHAGSGVGWTWSGTAFIADKCILTGMRTLCSTLVSLDECDVTVAGETIALASDFTATGLRVKLAAGAETWNVGANYADIQMDIVSTTRSSSGGGAADLTVAGSAASAKRLALRNGANSGLVNISLTGAAWSYVNLFGVLGNVTVPACTQEARVDGGTGNLDITGPATLDVTTAGTAIIRGKRVSGHISTSQGASSGQAVSFIDADESRLDVAATPSTSTGTHKPYTFDASSANNVLTISGRSLFAAAGTDSGTNNRVLPEGAAPPAAGFAPADATYLVTTADATLTNEVPVGATPGGELGGTWAAPTVDPLHSGSQHADFQLLTEKGAASGYQGLDASANLPVPGKVYPSTPAGVLQTAVGLYGGTGAPNNADGADGDIYFRSDGGALTTMYQRRAGAWVGII